MEEIRMRIKRKDRIENVLKLTLDGISQTDIAKQYGITRQGIHDDIKYLVDGGVLDYDMVPVKWKKIPKLGTKSFDMFVEDDVELMDDPATI